MKSIISIAALLALAGCASSGGSHAGFPDVSKANPAGGAYVNLDDLRQYNEGMSKQQLYRLLGTPHFNEGMWGVRKWNYVFNLRPALGAQPLTCQFQVHFDAAGMATGHAWQPTSCGALLQPPPVPTPIPTAPVSKVPLRLSADALFAFDSASLSPKGQQSLDTALSGKLEAVGQLHVVGHSDRIGRADYNLALSQQRADAVKQHLIQRGVPAAAIRAEGRGSSEPVAQCGQSDHAALVACLAPNRRVEISGIGD